MALANLENGDRLQDVIKLKTGPTSARPTLRPTTKDVSPKANSVKNKNLEL